MMILNSSNYCLSFDRSVVLLAVVVADDSCDPVEHSLSNFFHHYYLCFEEILILAFSKSQDQNLWYCYFIVEVLWAWMESKRCQHHEKRRFVINTGLFHARKTHFMVINDSLLLIHRNILFRKSRSRWVTMKHWPHWVVYRQIEPQGLLLPPVLPLLLFHWLSLHSLKDFQGH